jgi:hypothetical protein
LLEICRFAYSETVKFDRANMLDILQAASQLEMKFLVEKTIDYISKDGINEHTIFNVLNVATKENNMRLNLKCFDYIQKNHQKCFKTNEFKLMPMETFKIMLQTCKIPKTAAIQAVALWSAHPSNKDEDLDELNALVSLNENEDEIENCPPDGNDAESVTSSRAGSQAGGQRRNMQNQQRGNQQNQRGGNQQNGNSNRNNNQRGFDNRRAPKDNRIVQQEQFMAQQFPEKLKQTQEMFPSLKNFTFQGEINRKNFKFANLDLQIFDQPISINEIHFVYDLSTTDKEVEIRIVDVTTNQRKPDLFYQKINTNGKSVNGMYTRYVLPRPCPIEKGSKIWISVVFNGNEYRLSFYNTHAPINARLGLRHDGEKNNNNGQVIKNIVFTD